MEATRALKLSDVQVNPNGCPLSSPLSVRLQIASGSLTKFSIRGAMIFDICHNRVRKELGVSLVVEVTPESSSVDFTAQSIDISDIERRILNNVAELRLEFIDENQELIDQVSMVVAIDDRDGVFHRTVFSPLV